MIWNGNVHDKSGFAEFDGIDKSIKLESFTDFNLIQNLIVREIKKAKQQGKEEALAHLTNFVKHQ